MAYNLRRGGGLRHVSRNGGLRDTESVNPMANISNVVDAMLVLALGLMIALVSYWNVALPDTSEVVEQNEVTEVSDVKNMSKEMTSGSSYDELGTVYQDPSTGKLYMLSEDVDKGASNTKKGSASSSSSK